MKVTTTTRQITETIYECEGCGHKSDIKIHTEICPKHGEFCDNCIVDKAKIVFPFVICPKCNIDIKILYEDLYHHKDPCLFPADGDNLRKPWILLADRADGNWIGSERPQVIGSD